MNIKKGKADETAKGDQLSITYYTDPLCCWSWAFEPQWRKFQYEYDGLFTFRYRMAGMIRDWNGYNDPFNSVTKPIQMGPLWMEAKHISGMPMKENIWVSDPPSTSYPSCVAVKCAGLQSEQAEHLYLRKAREVLMTKGKNISKSEILSDIAQQVSKEHPGVLDLNRFILDYNNNNGIEAFKEDLEKVRYHKIGRYPTLTIEKPGARGVMITGYRPYNVFLDAVKQVDPELINNRKTGSEEGIKTFFGKLLDRELEELKSIVTEV